MFIHVYAYYGRGNSIHSHCWIEWFHNTCVHKSHHVGGKQVITFIDGYPSPLECRSGLLYMSILCTPTDQDLDQYTHVLSPVHMNGIPLYWNMHILTHVDTPLAHLTVHLGTKMTPR